MVVTVVSTRWRYCSDTVCGTEKRSSSIQSGYIMFSPSFQVVGVWYAPGVYTRIPHLSFLLFFEIVDGGYGGLRWFTVVYRFLGAEFQLLTRHNYSWVQLGVTVADFSCELGFQVQIRISGGDSDFRCSCVTYFASASEVT